MNDELKLSQTETKYVERLRQLQRVAESSSVPQVLTVFVERSTIAFFDGKPSGKERQDKQGKRP